MIHRSGPGKAKKKTVGEVLAEQYRVEANTKAKWWADLLEINKDLILELPFPSDASNSVDGVNLAVKRKFGNLIKTPKIMAKILGAKDG